jgi:hypothetical protein
MAEDTGRQETEADDATEQEEDAEAERLLAEAVGREVDEDGDPIPAGTGKDTVSREDLLKAVKGRQAAKQKARELQQQINELRAQHESESEKAVREAAEKAIKAMESRYKPALVKATATSLLLAAQPKKGKDGIPRLLKLMNLDDIEVGDDQTVEGVEDEVARLQADYPELFGEDEKPAKESTEADEEKPTTRRTTSRAQDGGTRKPPAAKKKSTAELIMAKMRGEA